MPGPPFQLRRDTVTVTFPQLRDTLEGGDLSALELPPDVPLSAAVTASHATV